MTDGYELTRYYYAQEREQFTLEADMYEGWAMLAPQHGSFLYRIGELSADWSPVGFGDLVFCPPGHRFERRALEPLSFHFAEFRLPEDALTAGKHSVTDLSRLGSTFAYLRAGQALGGEPANDAGHLLGDLIWLARREQREASQRIAAAADPLMQEAAACLAREAEGGELSLQALAARLGLSGPQLTRRFQAAYGVTPVRYATAVRLSKARRLLVETEHTLETIAELCGYQNAFYLSRVFTQHMRMSPSVYRKTYRV